VSADVTEPRVAIGPSRPEFAVAAVRAGGGQPAETGNRADGLIWLAPQDAEGLQAALVSTSARWIQLSSAGVELVVEAGVLDPARTWTCAKGSYAEPVAEHALLLALAGLRSIRQRVEARSWGELGGQSLYDEPVSILGGGGITRALLTLLAPFRVTATVVRRSTDPFPGAARTLPHAMLPEALSDAKVVFIALALTPQTERIVGAPQLDAMRPDGWLVNVARGRHVDTGALLTALEREQIGGAALDVTDPEPLPDGHPLWTQPRCIITPHTADTPEMTMRPLALRIRENVARFTAGEPMLGLVDPQAGY